jgi:protein-tyrosine phosphatase
LIILISVPLAATTPNRPTSLFLTKTTTDRPVLRTCLSHPSTSPSIFSSSEDNPLSPFKFTSLTELSSPAPKRLRPQTLVFTPICSAVAAIPIPSLPSSSTSSIRFINPSELADKLKEKVVLTIFDCGSLFRHSEHRIRNSVLLRVADKISRKRLKTNSKRHSTIDIKHLNESQFIILYDDNTKIRRHCTDQIERSSSDNNQLSAAFKCACEEIQRCHATNFPPILILNSPFNHFFDLYPNLCESLQPRSCPSSPLNHPDESLPPPSAPPIQSSTLLTMTTNENNIDNHPMTHIIDGLFIGSESNAKNLEELSTEQIRHIVNVTSHVPLYHADQLQYCHLPADDTQKQNLLEYFDQAYSFINQAIVNNEKVLVHCVAGISRSPAIVIGFLMRYAKMNMNDAYDFVKRKRSIVSPNLNFMGQLLEYEKKLKQQK